MVAINGIGAVTGTNEPIPADKKQPKRAERPTHDLDAVSFSNEAAQAADASRLVRESQELSESEARQERIEQAKRNIEEGAHRLQSVVLEIAARITGYTT